jgi:ABC-2 type transport system permease protein
MRNIWVILKREFLAYFNSPIAYIFVIVFLTVNSGLFMASFFFSPVAEMRYFFEILPITLAVFMPTVTMRMWAEERRMGTISLLLSLPARNHELVLGKFLASFLFYCVALAGTLTIPIMLVLAGTPDMGPIIGGYIGLLFLGAFFLSIGLFVSVLFRDQILAFVVALVLCFGFYLLGTDLVAIPLDGWTGGLGTVVKDVFGLANRLTSVERGILDIGDVVYFLAYTAAFLLLNVYALESRIRMRGASIFPAGVVLVVAIAAVVSMFTSDVGLPRFDLTENGIYTMSPVTGEILADLKAPVSVRYYVTPRDRMPTQLKNLERDVADKLEELRRNSPMFTFEVIDPTQNLEQQQRLQEQGIVPFPSVAFEQDSQEIKLVYSAISVLYLDKPEEIIPAVRPEELGQLEYELASSIYRMMTEKKPMIAVYSPVQYQDPRLRDESFRELLAKMGQPVPPPVDRFMHVKNFLEQQGYDVAPVSLEGESGVPEDAKTLLVIEPEELKPEQVKKIEDFLARGRNLFVAVQKYTYVYTPAPDGGIDPIPSKMKSGIEPFLRKLGVRVSDNALMDSASEPITMRVQRRFGNVTMDRPEQVKLPMQIVVRAENMDEDTGITDRLGALVYWWGSALGVDDNVLKQANLKATALFTSSKDSWTVAVGENPLKRQDTRPEGHAKEGPLPLAFYITGPAPGSGGKDADSEIVVVGCAEMFADNFLGWASNAMFLLNCVDSMSLDVDLASIRSKGSVAKPVGEMDNSEKLFYRFLTLGFVPVVFIALGIVRSVLRRRRRAAYLRRYS